MRSPEGTATVGQRFWSRVTKEWRLKALLSVVQPLFFAIPYFSLQHFSWGTPTTLELSVIDRAVPFEPAWAWVYQSTYVLLSLFPWLATERLDLLRYAAGFVGLCSVAFGIFALWPVECPRPDQVPNTGMYAWVISYDGVRNAFPCLHCGLAAYTVWFGGKALGLNRFAFVGSWIWVCAIAYSTLATKQHYFIDIPAGIALAGASHWLVGVLWATTPARVSSSGFERIVS